MARDRLGEWFQILHDLGENTEAWVGRVRASGDADWIHLPHQRFDGIDAFTHGLARHGIEARLEGTGGGTRQAFPPFPVRVVRAVSALRKARPSARGWRATDPAWRPDPERRPRPHAAAWCVFSREETAALDAAARRGATSVNSLLLWAVHRAVAPWLDDSVHPACWMVPVNMRDALDGAPIATNRVAFVDVRLGAAATIEETHAAIRGELSAGAHFTAWDAYQIAGALGMLPRRAERVMAAPPRRTGVFSNVGVWTAAGAGESDAWVLCPPPLRSTPFTSTAVVLNGRLSFMVLIHPSVRAGVEDARRIVEGFRSVLSDVA